MISEHPSDPHSSKDSGMCPHHNFPSVCAICKRETFALSGEGEIGQSVDEINNTADVGAEETVATKKEDPTKVIQQRDALLVDIEESKAKYNDSGYDAEADHMKEILETGVQKAIDEKRDVEFIEKFILYVKRVLFDGLQRIMNPDMDKISSRAQRLEYWRNEAYGTDTLKVMADDFLVEQTKRILGSRKPWRMY